jgi:hypothetical protein
MSSMSLPCTGVAVVNDEGEIPRGELVAALNSILVPIVWKRI